MNKLFYSGEGTAYATALMAKNQISIDEILSEIAQAKASIQALLGTPEADAWEIGAFNALDGTEKC